VFDGRFPAPEQSWWVIGLLFGQGDIDTPLLQTKLYIPPPRPELVSRPRLIERLDAGKVTGQGCENPQQQIQSVRFMG
jgi:hypothetical protein